MSCIYVLSPQHTGTWFTLAFLDEHPEVWGVCQTKFIIWLLAGNPNTHQLDRAGTRFLTEKLGGRGDVSVIHSHIVLSQDNKIHALQVANMILSETTVIPLRDPALAIISHMHRNHSVDPQGAARKWIALAECLQDIAPAVDPVFLPLDLLITEEQREAALVHVLGRCGLATQPHAHRWAVYWPMGINDSACDDAKQAYRCGDFEKVEQVCPGLRDALKMMADSGAVFSLLTERGYSLKWL